MIRIINSGHPIAMIGRQDNSASHMLKSAMKVGQRFIIKKYSNSPFYDLDLQKRLSVQAAYCRMEQPGRNQRYGCKAANQKYCWRADQICGPACNAKTNWQ